MHDNETLLKLKFLVLTQLEPMTFKKIKNNIDLFVWFQLKYTLTLHFLLISFWNFILSKESKLCKILILNIQGVLLEFFKINSSIF